MEIREFLIDLCKNYSVTVFVSSHNLGEVARLATRIGIIHEGRLLKELDTLELHSIRTKRLIVRASDNLRAKELLVREGYSVTSADEKGIELTDERALLHPDNVASLLVQSNIPPTTLWEKEDNLNSLTFSRIYSNNHRLVSLTFLQRTDYARHFFYLPASQSSKFSVLSMR